MAVNPELRRHLAEAAIIVKFTAPILVGLTTAGVILAREGTITNALLAVSIGTAINSMIPLDMEVHENLTSRRLRNHQNAYQSHASYRHPPTEPPTFLSTSPVPLHPIPGGLSAAVALEIPKEVELVGQFR